jgi:hypothetical protein
MVLLPQTGSPFACCRFRPLVARCRAFDRLGGRRVLCRPSRVGAQRRFVPRVQRRRPRAHRPGDRGCTRSVRLRRARARCVPRRSAMLCSRRIVRHLVVIGAYDASCRPHCTLRAGVSRQHGSAASTVPAGDRSPAAPRLTRSWRGVVRHCGAFVRGTPHAASFHVVAARRGSAVERGGCVLSVGRCLLHVVVGVACHHCRACERG